ncbi:alpha/beta hydrolase [Psychromarinibacter sp. C21-152]|uniref:Alpha/beta hydrolase n=1 Tax=Psychromarinibacter sediminicola TaxID=3033385 RepID=A0AAE3NSN2_9RHOB|nr:alpha/beta hydrolase [Psychromarinibacter sediminicola]MDF0603528.1 alpha/beta hydrolase [Psychromarinibacter sediminicola]
MKKVELNGAEFVYDSAGDAHEHAIVVLHGGRGQGDHRRDFEAFRPLADSYQVLAYDQRGCGLSSLTPPYTFAQFADDLEAFRKEVCGGKKITLIGGSFGGMIALTYAVKYQAGLSHLILRGTTPSYHFQDAVFAHLKDRLHKAPSASEDMIRKMIRDGCEDDLELRLILFASQPLYYEDFDPDAALAELRELHIHAETHRELFRNDKYYDVRDKLSTITVPTFVVVGLNDWICPPGESRLIAQSIPGAELMEVEGANHPVHIEKSELVLGRIRKFMEENV